MRALNTLLESCSEQPALISSLEVVMLPMLQRCLNAGGQDVFEELLEMLAYLTYYQPTIGEGLWSLWPALEAAANEWAVDYWENLLVPLDNYISKGTERFLTCPAPDYKASLFGMVRNALTGDYEERGVAPAAKALDVVLQSCRGRVDEWVAPYVHLALQRLATATNRTLKVGRRGSGGRGWTPVAAWWARLGLMRAASTRLYVPAPPRLRRRTGWCSWWPTRCTTTPASRSPPWPPWDPPRRRPSSPRGSAPSSRRRRAASSCTSAGCTTRR